MDAIARPSRRNVWGAAYIGLGLMGLFTLLPTFAPPVFVPFFTGAHYVWGTFELFFFAAAAFAFSGNTKLEQAFLWLGTAGTATYVMTIWYRVFNWTPQYTPQALGFTVLLGLLVATGAWLGQHARREARREKIIAIAERE